MTVASTATVTALAPDRFDQRQGVLVRVDQHACDVVEDVLAALARVLDVGPRPGNGVALDLKAVERSRWKDSGKVEERQ